MQASPIRCVGIHQTCRLLPCWRNCQVGVLVPRGRFDIEMYMSSLKLVGQVGVRVAWRGSVATMC